MKRATKRILIILLLLLCLCGAVALAYFVKVKDNKKIVEAGRNYLFGLNGCQVNHEEAYNNFNKVLIPRDMLADFKTATSFDASSTFFNCSSLSPVVQRTHGTFFVTQ